MSDLLIIDSDDKARIDIRKKIEDSPFHYLNIHEASMAREGLQLIKQIQPCVIIMDISLKDEDGISFGKSVIQLYPAIRILIVSHLQMFEIVQSAINAGFSGYYLKPISRTELLSGLERILTPSLDTMKTKANQHYGKGMESIDLANPIESALRYIQDNYHLPLTLNEVASMVYLSQSHFSRLFKSATGMTFVEYLTQVRIQKSKYLLKMSSLPIDVIAHKTGFSNASYFATTFKRLEGKTPTEYRELLQKIYPKTGNK
ncbi:two-component response regulator (plasmid) [Geobacillus kaustophilus HTA426]|uniref:Two-component response regulator n=1 Tax=Geobacillus kaustophilus (strain HTA426) TaxID=235909 RepID=Q5QL43_GEOKA|nr:helix-turn-helix domain-containing protein [Geobacillus kaustophilus]BAD74267.1 two-component response regulator [Geobacillus kaustophilus HTA426]